MADWTFRVRSREEQLPQERSPDGGWQKQAAGDQQVLAGRVANYADTL
jgi:hypothetical protein